MFCPHCRAETSSVRGLCTTCGKPQAHDATNVPDDEVALPSTDSAPQLAETASMGTLGSDLPETAYQPPGILPGATGSVDGAIHPIAGLLSPGQAFGTRYHVVR